jgi:hypothetical protein
MQTPFISYHSGILAEKKENVRTAQKIISIALSFNAFCQKRKKEAV